MALILIVLCTDIYSQLIVTMISLLAVLVSSALVGLVRPQVASYFSNNDRVKFHAMSEKILKAGAVNSFQNYYSLKYLQAIEQRELWCDCLGLERLLNNAESSYEIFYNIESARMCNCDISIPQSAQNMATQDLQVDNFHTNSIFILLSMNSICCRVIICINWQEEFLLLNQLVL